MPCEYSMSEHNPAALPAHDASAKFRPAAYYPDLAIRTTRIIPVSFQVKEVFVSPTVAICLMRAW